MNAKRDQSANVGLFVLRLVVGAVFMMHGGQKLFVLGLPGVAAFMTRLAIPAPNIAAVVVTLVEFIGGALLILGLFARPAAALIAIDMTVAVLVVHLHNGFFLPTGFEFALTLLCACIAVVLMGAGAWSVDGWVQSGTSGQDHSAPVR